MKLTVSEALAQVRIDESPLYCAASPGYPCNFTRDSLTYAYLAEDIDAMRAQIAFSATHQGKKKDAATGEEPGKIHHEIDIQPPYQVENEGFDTTYNACDTTALFLESLAFLAENGQPEVLQTYSVNIDAAIDYIYRHLGEDYLFREDPYYSGASNTPSRRFALKVTYWKDSVLNDKKEEPDYPIAYALPQFQNAHALRSIGRVMNRPQEIQTAEEMEQAGIKKFWRNGRFIVAIDGQVRIVDPPSSDSLHSLRYIDPNSLPKGYAESIEEDAIILETPAGYRAGIPTNGISDGYHTNYIWTHEQALLHEAAIKHRLPRAMAVSKRILSQFNGNFPELIDAGTLEQAGNPVQLWAIGSRLYFR